MRIGVFGGSFDPIHHGHLILAEHCRQHARMDRILFVPAATSPFKPDGPMAGDKERVEMLRLAIAGHEPFTVSTCELDRGGVSYTVDTIKELAHEYQDDEVFLIIGADALEDFTSWKEPETICQLATPLIFGRLGHATSLQILENMVSESRLKAIDQEQVEFPLIEISGTRIRKAISLGQSVRFLLPRSVEKYIETHGLYSKM